MYHERAVCDIIRSQKAFSFNSLYFYLKAAITPSAILETGSASRLSSFVLPIIPRAFIIFLLETTGDESGSEV